MQGSTQTSRWRTTTFTDAGQMTVTIDPVAARSFTGEPSIPKPQTTVDVYAKRLVPGPPPWPLPSRVDGHMRLVHAKKRREGAFGTKNTQLSSQGSTMLVWAENTKEQQSARQPVSSYPEPVLRAVSPDITPRPLAREPADSGGRITADSGGRIPIVVSHSTTKDHTKHRGQRRRAKHPASSRAADAASEPLPSYPNDATSPSGSEHEEGAKRIPTKRSHSTTKADAKQTGKRKSAKQHASYRAVNTVVEPAPSNPNNASRPSARELEKGTERFIPTEMPRSTSNAATKQTNDRARAKRAASSRTADTVLGAAPSHPNDAPGSSAVSFVQRENATAALQGKKASKELSPPSPSSSRVHHTPSQGHRSKPLEAWDFPTIPLVNPTFAFLPGYPRRDRLHSLAMNHSDTDSSEQYSEQENASIAQGQTAAHTIESTHQPSTIRGEREPARASPYTSRSLLTGYSLSLANSSSRVMALETFRPRETPADIDEPGIHEAKSSTKSEAILSRTVVTDKQKVALSAGSPQRRNADKRYIPSRPQVSSPPMASPVAETSYRNKGKNKEDSCVGMVRIYLQDACLRHKFIRDRDASNVFERPERLRAVNIGIAAAYARLEAAALNISMASGRTNAKISPPFVFVRSAKSIRILEHDAARYIHGGAGTEDSPTMHSYGASLEAWCLDSAETIAKGQSEIPPNFEQDLYLSPESMSAFEGALGTVCEAVDDVMTSRPIYSAPNRGTQLDGRAFVVVRPPGHHCSEDTPMGFGFVNNVAVGAVHASKEHGIRRVVIFDYDLHHGNGTQTIVRNINERLNANGVRASALDPLIFYGSIHDILSYPCEDGDPDLVDDASLSLSGVNGNWIENIHLQAYASEAQFWEYYHRLYSRLFSSATRFIENTGGAALDDVLVFISSGFDASEYETEDMSRHERKVPTAFYHRFTRDACKFAGKYAAGRIISVLEGGYSDRALTSGALAHVTALADVDGITDQDWWDSKRLAQLEKATKRRRGRPARSDKLGSWLRRTVEIFKVLDTPTGENTSEVIRVPDLADDVKQAMQEEMRQTSLKRKQTNPGPQTRAKRSKTAIDPKRVHLGAPTDERESSDDDDAR